MLMTVFSRSFFSKLTSVNFSRSVSLLSSKPTLTNNLSKHLRTDGLTENVQFSNADKGLVNPMKMTNPGVEGQATVTKPEKILQPPLRKGMQILDKSAFSKTVKIPTVLITDTALHQIIKDLRPYLLKLPKIKPVSNVTCEASGTDSQSASKKKVFLNPELLRSVELEDLTLFMTDKLKLDPEIAASGYFEEIEFTYENWSWNQILDAILPDDQDKVSGFSHVGHIIHLNLREHLLPFKTLIAEVLLDKINQSKTVVNKLNSIDNTYRNFQMEILAGEPQTIVKVKQSQCEFEFDFAKVYWNPRLSTEHERIYKMLQPGDVLYDVFAGVGPFSIPVGKKKCSVLANDLNPDSFLWLQNNVKKNKVHQRIQCFNKDGRIFIQEDIASHLQQHINSPDSFDFTKQKFHVAMNLPAMAVEFLSSFWNLIPKKTSNVILPTDLIFIVHVYCFIKDIDGYKEKARKLVESSLNYDLLDEDVIDIHFVRNVAPNKEMLRVSFKMPHEILSPCENNGCNSVKRKISEVE